MNTLPLRLIALALLLCACSREAPPVADKDSTVDAAGNTPASEFTARANAAEAASLPTDTSDIADAERGLIEREQGLVIESSLTGRRWSADAFSFLQGEVPASVNPGLWRQARLNGMHGLYKVAEGIYQVRGYDISNMTWIRGKSGWIVVDPLTSVETAAAATRIARKHLGNDPVVAVIFTHSHVDHFSGVGGLLGDARTEGLRVIAPARFVEELTSENIMAGIGMGRRASYQFGYPLSPGVRGYVDSGLGRQPLSGTSSFLMPTESIDRTPQDMQIDGVDFVFQYTPDSEAPAELAFYLPAWKAWCGAEIVSRTMHNLYTLRGAKVRDALKWSGYIDDANRRFGDMELVFTSHNWPVFGHDRAIAFLKGQRDTYRYTHDQTLRLANQGATPREIAEQLELPPQLSSQFANRGYYGTLRHNAKAVYQFYFGWYDANPANLDPLPPEELGKRYVEAIGGAAALKSKAKTAIAAGDYRWAASLLDNLVFAEPDDTEAKELLARAYDQLGYQAESGVWRSAYLTGAHELRHGSGGAAMGVKNGAAILEHIPLDLFFAAMATRLNGPRAAKEEPFSINFEFTDVNETHVLQLENAVLHHHREEAPDPAAVATVRLSRGFFLRMITGAAGIRDLVFSDEISVEGSRTALLGFFGLLDSTDGNFAIVTP